MQLNCHKAGCGLCDGRFCHVPCNAVSAVRLHLMLVGGMSATRLQWDRT